MNLALTNVATVANPIVNDLAFDDTGNLYFSTGSESTVTSIKTRCQMFLGEWFLNRREGIPYYRHVFVKIQSTQVIRSLFRGVILGTPGVDSLNSMTLNLDKASRTMAITFEAILSTGEVASADFDLFILEV